uniref:Neurotransmitter-gated ion-channel ligand-binding domain-containing protein n=1 Tax=Meloidogyne incognita TaxID=6306 RepID=A0A914LZJ6_MELIC
MLNTINGTFFRLLTQLELIDTREFEFGNSPNYLGLEFSLFVHFRDDRLQFRDLNDLPISLPDEFTPWQPRIQILPLLTTQTIQSQKSIHLNPKNGLITFVYRFSGQLFCISDIWKEPFEKYSCQFWFETELDERLQLTVIRDLRPTEQINKIGNEYEQWPWLLLRFNFCSSKWKKALICEYLPSLMLFVCALLAQWKRRKIQVVVLIGVIICLILLQNILHSKNISSTFSIKLNLMDFWLAGIFVHLISLLSIDLAFPSRRVIIFKQKIIKKRINDNNDIPLESKEIDNELIVVNFE